MFAKYLPNFGWNPWVLTRSLSHDDPRFNEKMTIDFTEKVFNQIIKIKYSLHDEQKYLESRSLFKIIRDFFYPEYSSPPGVFFAAKKAAEQLLNSQRFDIILATIPDQWELTLGAYLSRKYHVPLIADFRDIREQERGLKLNFRQRLQSSRFAMRRRFTIRQASGVTTVSKYHRKVLQKKFGKPTFLIYNGFDSEIFTPSAIRKYSAGPFRIVYMGRILDLWYRNPEVLFTAIDQLIFEGCIEKHDITVEFYGTDCEKLDGLVKMLRSPTFIRFNDRINYTDVPQKLGEAQMVLLLTNFERKGILTTKLFEYAGVRKPILCIPGDQGELDEIISHYGLGYSFSSVSELKVKLVEWLGVFKSGEFPECVESKIEIFTRKNQTAALSKHLDGIISSSFKN